MTKEEMKTRTCCFTGHRRIPHDEINRIKHQLRDVIVYSIESGYVYFGAGGALGFDTLAAQSVLELKNKYAHIRLILVLPCLSQTKNWREPDIVEYERIKKNADKIVYISQEYTQDCMYKRNRHLINNSSLCICYLKRQTGGTAYTVRYGKEQGLKICNLANYHEQQL